MLINLRNTLEYLAGERDELPQFLTTASIWLVRCAVWLFAIALIYAFCGQTSKFIYIDF